MKRYIVDKAALDLLLISPLRAIDELAKEKVITDEPLIFKHLTFVSVVLSEEQVKLLIDNGFEPKEEEIIYNALLASDYEKIRSAFYKAGKRAFRGTGVKVGVLDSGCNTAFVPCEFTINFADGNPFQDVFGHGTKVTSIIKHPIIGLAPDCIMYGIKVATDTGVLSDSAILAGLDYAIDESLDIINISFAGSTSSTMQTAIADCIAAGIMVSAASGNDIVDSFTASPATFPGVVAVNAISEDGTPYTKNIIPNPVVSGSHGITVACSGRGSECCDKNGNIVTDFGTSFSSPFFVGLFSIYKQALSGANNQEVLDYTLNRVRKTTYADYFGIGTPSF